MAYLELLTGVFVGFGKYTSEVGDTSGTSEGGITLVVAQRYLCIMLFPVTIVGDGNRVSGAAFGHGFLHLSCGESGVFGQSGDDIAFL